ncbi:MAG: ABC transporter ATP-binding protein [Bacteroidales bacterium]|nr:ABC transporter ATP-binding protein [Bacteroidales bacterium]
MKPIWRVLRYIKHYPFLLSLHIGFILLHALFNLSSYVLIIPFLELIFGMTAPPDTLPELALNATSLSDYMLYHLYAMKDSLGIWNCLLIISAAYLAMSFLANLFRFLSQFFVAPIRNGIVQHLRDDVYRQITILPVSYFNSRRRGDIISRMSNDLADVEWSVVTTITALAKDPVNIIFFATTLIVINARLFLYMLVIAPVTIFLIGLIGKSLKRNSFKGQTALGGLFSILEEGLGGIRTIKAFGREGDMQQRFEESNSEYTRRMIRVAKRKELSGPLSEILATLVLVAILIIGASLVIGGEMGSSTFIFFVLIFLRLIPPVHSIIKAYNNLQKGNASAARFFQIIDADEQIIEKPNAEEIKSFDNTINYSDVSFAYTTDAPNAAPVTVLDHINLSIPKGRSIAIVGPSGAGKTTLIDLLPRFYDCTGGEILIDGKPIKDLNITSLRSLFGEVSQHCILFNDTVANNIAFGHEHYPRQKIIEAARLANADEFISQLPQGYDTPIGDRGMTLSGGQRQRLSIARAILKNPPILIFDEATSALDAESEKAVQQALENLKQGRTTITIAHRLATIKNADEIIVMDKGHIVEQGTYDTLIQQGGLYKHLVEMQLL